MNYIMYARGQEVFTAYEFDKVWHVNVIDGYGSEFKAEVSYLMLIGLLSAITIEDDMTYIVEKFCRDTKYEARS